MFAALAMVAKDKLGFWSSRAKGASEACFLFCYFFCAENAVLCCSDSPSSQGQDGRRGDSVREWCCWGLAGLGVDFCLFGQK